MDEKYIKYMELKREFNKSHNVEDLSKCVNALGDFITDVTDKVLKTWSSAHSNQERDIIKTLLDELQMRY